MQSIFAKVPNALNATLIDGVFASEACDKTAEVLDVAGCDISSMEAGEGVLNYEHRKADANGATPNDNLGKIVYVKKIFSEDDCEDERQRYFWSRVRKPLIYGIVRLFDGAQHPGAVALAAQIRDYYANKEKIVCRFSIDGTTLQRDGHRLSRTIGRDVALALKPCNNTCDSGVIFDPVLDGGQLQRSERDIGGCALFFDAGRDVPDPLLPAQLRKSELEQRARQLMAGILQKTAEALRGRLRKFDQHDAAAPGGARFYVPSRASDAHARDWAAVTSDPRVRQLHSRALEGWRRAAELLAQGLVPRSSVEHALRVSGLSAPAPRRSEWSALDGLRKGSETAVDPGLLSAVHAAVTVARGDAPACLAKLGELGLDYRQARQLMALVGHGRCLVLDSPLVQHLFAADQMGAQSVLGSMDPGALAALEDSYSEHDSLDGLDNLPASWLQWLVAPAHASSCGMPEIAHDRTGLFEIGVPAGGPWPPDQTADLQRGWSRRFGDCGATMLYFAHLAPR